MNKKSAIINDYSDWVFGSIFILTMLAVTRTVYGVSLATMIHATLSWYPNWDITFVTYVVVLFAWLQPRFYVSCEIIQSGARNWWMWNFKSAIESNVICVRPCMVHINGQDDLHSNVSLTLKVNQVKETRVGISALEWTPWFTLYCRVKKE